MGTATIRGKEWRTGGCILQRWVKERVSLADRRGGMGGVCVESGERRENGEKEQRRGKGAG